MLDSPFPVLHIPDGDYIDIPSPARELVQGREPGPILYRLEADIMARDYSYAVMLPDHVRRVFGGQNYLPQNVYNPIVIPDLAYKLTGANDHSVNITGVS